MYNLIKGSLLFGAGFAIGAFGMYLYRKRKFDDNLDSMAKQIKKDMEEEQKKNISYNYIKPEEQSKAQELAKAAENKPSITNYTKMYSGETIEVDESSYEIKEKNDISLKVISEDQLYEGDGINYAGQTLILYADGVLTNADNEPVKVKETIGDDFLARFYGSEEEDRIFVRNDETLTDYEIVKSSETYASKLQEASEEEE